MLALICSLLFIPAQSAFAVSHYASEELVTNVDVEPDASLKVTSRQLLMFDGQNEGLCWYLGAPVNDESFKILRVRVAPVDDGGGVLDGWTRLQMIDVNKAAQGASPGGIASVELRQEGQRPWYSYSISDGMIRCWFPTDPGRYVLEVEYTIFNSVSVFRDVAELSWRYAHASYPVDMHDVILQINLPMPEGEVVIPNETVYAWGHGPDDGWFTIEENGFIIYHIESLPAGRHADAHVIFPARWMDRMYSNSPRLFTETNKAEILQAESLWVDAYTRQQNWDFNVRILFLSLAAVLLAVGVIGVLRFGQTSRSRRLLIRLAVILLCMGLGVSLFFWEPVSEWMLFGIAAIVAIIALFFPKQDMYENGFEETRYFEKESEDKSEDESENGPGEDKQTNQDADPLKDEKVRA